MSRPALSLPSSRDEEPDDDQLLLPAVGGRQEQAQPVQAREADGGVLSRLTGADVSSVLTVDRIPAPYDVAEDVSAPLSDQERGHLSVCEAALHAFRKSVVVAGKALEVINRGRLYRETHGTFVEYLDDVWGIRKSHAYRMIEEWPVAAAVSPIGDINEAQARELLPVFREHGQEATVVLFREARELSGGKVTAAALAEARAVLPPPRRLAGPGQVSDVLRVAAAEGRLPRLAPQPKAQERDQEQTAGAQDEPGDIGRGELDEGAEAVATLEAALAQQRQIYDRVGGGVLAAALLYDPGRGERLRHELRQFASRTAYRMRDPAKDGGDDTET
nr:hypothetical protein [Streptomyces chartreusis]